MVSGESTQAARCSAVVSARVSRAPHETSMAAHVSCPGLSEPRGFHFLRQGNAMAIDGVDDAANFAETCRAMEVLQIDDRNQRLVFRALVAVLQIGNVSFVDSHTDAELKFRW